MSSLSTWASGARFKKIAPVAAATMLVAGLGVAQAATSSPAAPEAASAVTAAKSSAPMRGWNFFGETDGKLDGENYTFRYTKGWFCDSTIKAASGTGCEAGVAAKKAPAKRFAPLYITVPLGFTVKAKHIDCPANLVCVDHPRTIDLTRLAPALAPLYKTTPAKLAPALRNFITPAHDHIVTTEADNKAIWWDVRIVGVTDPKVFKAIQDNGSLEYVESLQKAKNPAVTATIPTNLFLFFSVQDA